MKKVYVGRVPVTVARKLAELLAEEALRQAMHGDWDEAWDIMDDAISLDRECQMCELEEEMEKGWEV